MTENKGKTIHVYAFGEATTTFIHTMDMLSKAHNFCLWRSSQAIYHDIEYQQSTDSLFVLGIIDYVHAYVLKVRSFSVCDIMLIVSWATRKEY